MGRDKGIQESARKRVNERIKERVGGPLSGCKTYIWSPIYTQGTRHMKPLNAIILCHCPAFFIPLSTTKKKNVYIYIYYLYLNLSFNIFNPSNLLFRLFNHLYYTIYLFYSLHLILFSIFNYLIKY